VSGLVALVTGASSDLGAAIAQSLANVAGVVFACGRNRDRLARTASGGNGRIRTIAADLTSDADIAGLRETVSQHGRLDILVLGSGIYQRSADPDTLVRQFAANVFGPYALLQAVLPLLVAAKGLVVFINSTQGLAASPGVGQFAATQHAMRAFADSTRGELNPLGVRVSTLFLGRTATARQAEIFAVEQRPYTPELLIQPADVAGMVAHLAMLPRTSEVVEMTLRPAIKSY
jgi:NADP-dependent 3-hydroxy acid dehydrogenase YdfG